MNDDTLILYYYDDGLSDEERSAVATALESDPALRERYRQLRRELEALGDSPGARAPAHAVARWHRSIERAAGEHAGRAGARRGFRFPSLAWGALAATLVAGMAIGWYAGDRSTPVPTVAVGPEDVRNDDPAPGPATARVSFARGLEVHLRQSRQDIARLDGGEDRTLLIMDILRQNRLFERSAQEHDAEDVARVLRAFEPVLMRLADEDISAQDAAALRARLMFELDVVLTKMQRSESDETDSI